MVVFGLIVVLAVGSTLGLPSNEAGLRFQHVEDTLRQLNEIKRAAQTRTFDPDTQNVYHLFTRANPEVSQILISGMVASLAGSNFNSQRRTVIAIHGWMERVETGFLNAHLIPAYLQAEDVNYIAVDWSEGAAATDYVTALANIIKAGRSVSRFIDWLNVATGASISQYHVVGHSFGGHLAGVVGRSVTGNVPLITSLDPAYPGWAEIDHRIKPADGIYVEAIHTNPGGLGMIVPCAHVDFYVNVADDYPGCGSNWGCQHGRAVEYFAESVVSGGFTGVQCDSYQDALIGNCSSSETLNLGGTSSKAGSTGVFFLESNAESPFSKG